MDAKCPSAGFIPKIELVNLRVARAINMMGNIGIKLNGLIEQSSAAGMIHWEKSICRVEVFCYALFLKSPGVTPYIFLKALIKLLTLR